MKLEYGNWNSIKGMIDSRERKVVKKKGELKKEEYF